MKKLSFVVIAMKKMKSGRKYCYNCGKPLYYNNDTDITIIDNIEDKQIYYDENDFDNAIKFNEEIMAINKSKQEVSFFYNDVLDRTILFHNIIECEIIEDSNIMESGGIGRALVGGFIAGRCRCNSWS